MAVVTREKQLALIAEQIARCRTCRQNKIGLSVPGEGSAQAKVVFIGEAPGKTEAKTGRPFVGRAGKILRALIAEVGLKENEVYITSPVKYLPKHGTPTRAEVVHGRKHLQEQLAIIQPTVIVLLGRVAALALLDEDVAIGQVHGTYVERDGQTYFFAYHPAAPLHSPKLRPELANDFKKLQRFVN